jgi:hypothetical protein
LGMQDTKNIYNKMKSHFTDNYEWRDNGFVFSILNTKNDLVGCVSLDATLKIKHFFSNNLLQKT